MEIKIISLELIISELVFFTPAQKYFIWVRFEFLACAPEWKFSFQKKCVPSFSLISEVILKSRRR
jgi:hypothetical protein